MRCIFTHINPNLSPLHSDCILLKKSIDAPFLLKVPIGRKITPVVRYSLNGFVIFNRFHGFPVIMPEDVRAIPKEEVRKLAQIVIVENPCGE